MTKKKKGPVVGRLPLDLTVDCPKRGGPDQPKAGHPGKVGWGTCSGCKFNRGLAPFELLMCSHAKARALALSVTAEKIKAWRERDRPEEQPSLF